MPNGLSTWMCIEEPRQEKKPKGWNERWLFHYINIAIHFIHNHSLGISFLKEKGYFSLDKWSFNGQDWASSKDIPRPTLRPQLQRSLCSPRYAIKAKYILQNLSIFHQYLCSRFWSWTCTVLQPLGLRMKLQITGCGKWGCIFLK